MVKKCTKVCIFLQGVGNSQKRQILQKLPSCVGRFCEGHVPDLEALCVSELLMVEAEIHERKRYNGSYLKNHLCCCEEFCGAFTYILAHIHALRPECWRRLQIGANYLVRTELYLQYNL